jgi:hypothetical protein
LPVAEAIVAKKVVLLVDLRSEDVLVEVIRPPPVRHGDHAVVEQDPVS